MKQNNFPLSQQADAKSSSKNPVISKKVCWATLINGWILLADPQNMLNYFTVKACVCYFLSNFYFSPNNSPLKTMKNVFYFI